VIGGRTSRPLQRAPTPTLSRGWSLCPRGRSVSFFEKLRQLRDIDGDPPPRLSSAPLPAALLPHCRGSRCTQEPAHWRHGRHNRRASCRRARAWSSWSGVVRPPLHRRDGKRRSLVRADPAGRGKSTWVRERVRAAPTVGCLHADVFIERSALDRIPTVIYQRRPHCYCPIASFSPWWQYPPSRALIQGCAEVLFTAVGQVYCRVTAVKEQCAS
jgi:hypothetical protein